jgi:hypothetical protein
MMAAVAGASLHPRGRSAFQWNRKFSNATSHVQPPGKNLKHGSSRREEAQITVETIIKFEPPHVGCYFFIGLLGNPLSLVNHLPDQARSFGQ